MNLRWLNGTNHKYCEHCWPTKRRSHFLLHVNYYLSRLTFFLSGSLSRRVESFYQRYIWGGLLEILSSVGIVKFVDNPDKSRLLNRSLIFFEEAKRRGLKIQVIEILGRFVDEFRFRYEGGFYYYEGIPLVKRNVDLIDDKGGCKRELERNEIPVARGRSFGSLRKAFRFGKKIGFPLVVKPSSGSLSHHVTCDINSDEELIKALRVAREYCPRVVVERFVEGDLFRASVIGKKRVFVCRKDRANVVGDGESTVEELIKEKNRDRGETDQMDTTLHKIPFRGVGDLGMILEKDKKLYLQDKYILSQGCDIINCKVHLKNRELFLRISEILDSELIGVDFICSEIEAPHDEQESAVIEVNSLPYLDMHQYPSHGEPEPVAEVVWDVVLNKLNDYVK